MPVNQPGVLIGALGSGGMGLMGSGGLILALGSALRLLLLGVGSVMAEWWLQGLFWGMFALAAVPTMYPPKGKPKPKGKGGKKK